MAVRYLASYALLAVVLGIVIYDAVMYNRQKAQKLVKKKRRAQTVQEPAQAGRRRVASCDREFYYVEL